jgi:hypothetical protein
MDDMEGGGWPRFAGKVLLQRDVMRLVGWLPFDLIPSLVHGWLQGGHSIAYCSISLFVPLRLGMAVCISWCVDSGIQQVTLCQTHR